MKRCPACNRTYTDVSLNFCLDDGTPLTGAATPPLDPQATVRYPNVRQTEPPATEIYNPPAPLLNQVPEMAAPRAQWTPGPPPPAKKSNAVWWILGTVVVVGVIGVGLLIMAIAIASLSDSNLNANANANENVRTVNRNSSANSNTSRTNTNTNTSSNLPASVSDDFSESKWGTGNSRFGEIWYADDEYHMRSKEKTYLVMYAPSNEYNTENANVKVTARSVDGTATTSGYGLIIHGEKKNNELEDYALLIYTGDEPQYEIVMHKKGNQTALVPWTRSSVIRSGTNSNQLEARIRGREISFYINGQYVNQITDTEDFRRGVVGFYTSDTADIAFDDLEITR